MQYTSLCCVVTWKTWQDHINASIVGALRRKQGSRKRMPRLQAKQDGDALPSLRSSNGNVSCRGTGLYHHAYWQMVKQRISTLHKKASGAVLVARCKTNAHVPVVLNNTGNCTKSSFDCGPPAAQPPQQCKDKAKYWRQHVLMGAMAVFFPVSASRLMTWGKSIDEASSSQSPKGIEGEENWIKNSIPNPIPSCTSHMPFSNFISDRRMSLKLLHCLDADQGARERGKADNFFKNCTCFLKTLEWGKWKPKGLIPTLLFDLQWIEQCIPAIKLESRF